MLELKSIVGGYGEKRVLNKVSFHISDSEIVGLVGPNGSGKSTVLKSIYGLVKVKNGDIIYNGINIQNRKPALNAIEGIVYLPQGRKVFDRLSVKDNLELSGFFLQNKKDLSSRINEVYDFFPVLADNRNKIAGKLSGGERQMLSLARCFITNPKLILLDEPSIGLAPRLVTQSMEMVQKLKEQLNSTILIVEQNVREVLKIVERVYVLRLGEILFEGTNLDKDTEQKIREIFLS